MIRVLVVDDQTLVRQGIRGLLELAEDVEVVAEAADGRDALELIASHSPDVVLLDIQMPVLDGLGVLDELDPSDPKAPAVLVLTTFDDDEWVIRSLRSGARGFLLKDATLEELTMAVRTLAQGGTLIQPAITRRIREGVQSPSPRSPGALPEPLTARETEILRLMAGGYSNREIACALNVATGTVKNHISAILGKLGVRDRTRAVLKAIDLGAI